MNKTAIIGLTLAAALAVPSTGAARGVSYEGKTSGGSSITFKRSGDKVSGIRTVVPMVCLETTGSGYSRAGAELFQPRGRFLLGKARKVKAFQPAAMNSGARATKTYRVKLRRSGRKVKGELSLTLSFVRPNYYRFVPYIYHCTGTASFTASPR